MRVLRNETSATGGSHAFSEVADVAIQGVLRATAASSEAHATAEGCSSSSEIVGLAIGGTPVVIPPDDPDTPQDESHIDIPVLTGTLHLNHEARVGGVIIRRAIWLDTNTPLGDVIGAETVAGFGC